MGAVAEAAIIGNGGQRMIGMLKHGFCLPQTVILNVNKGRTAEKLLEIADVGGAGHTGDGIKCLQFDFFTVIRMNVFYGFQQVEQIPLTVLIGGFFLSDHIADLGDDIQGQVFLFLLRIALLLFFKGCQFMKYADQVVVFGNIDMKETVDQVFLISEDGVNIKQDMIACHLIQACFILSEKVLMKQ